MRAQKIKSMVMLAGIAWAAASPSPGTTPGTASEPPRSGIDVQGNSAAEKIVQPGETTTGKQDTPGKTGLGNVEGAGGKGGGVGTIETHDARGGAGAGGVGQPVR